MEAAERVSSMLRFGNMLCKQLTGRFKLEAKQASPAAFTPQSLLSYVCLTSSQRADGAE